MNRIACGAMALILILFVAGCAANEKPGDGEGTLPGTGQQGGEVPSTVLPPEDSPAPALENPVTFLDSAGRGVVLPQPLQYIAPGNLEAQSVLFSLAPEKLAGWYKAPAKSASAYIGDSYMALPSFCGQGTEELDWTAVKAAEVQAVLLMGSAIETGALDAMQEAAGLPVVFIDSGLDTLPEAYRALGGLLGMEEQAEEFVEYIAPAIEGLSTYASGITEAERKKVYIASGTDGLTPLDSDILPLAGALNAVESGKLATPLSKGEFDKLGADILLAPNADIYGKLIKEAAWNKLEPVEMGLFYAAPNAVFSWLQDTTTAGRLFGAKWLGNLLYPEVFAYNMVEETKLHYDLFWHCPLTDAQAEELLLESTLRPRG